MKSSNSHTLLLTLLKQVQVAPPGLPFSGADALKLLDQSCFERVFDSAKTMVKSDVMLGLAHLAPDMAAKMFCQKVLTLSAQLPTGERNYHELADLLVFARKLFEAENSKSGWNDLYQRVKKGQASRKLCISVFNAKAALQAPWPTTPVPIPPQPQPPQIDASIKQDLQMAITQFAKALKSPPSSLPHVNMAQPIVVATPSIPSSRAGPHGSTHPPKTEAVKMDVIDLTDD